MLAPTSGLLDTLFGVLGGGLVTVVGQALADRRASKRRARELHEQQVAHELHEQLVARERHEQLVAHELSELRGELDRVRTEQAEIRGIVIGRRSSEDHRREPPV